MRLRRTVVGGEMVAGASTGISYVLPSRVKNIYTGTLVLIRVNSWIAFVDNLTDDPRKHTN